MDIFAGATDTAFADDNFATDALWRSQGKGDPVACRVMHTQPSDVLTVRDARVIARGELVEVRASEVAVPQQFDTVEIPAESLLLQISGEPQSDENGLVWSCEAKRKG